MNTQRLVEVVPAHFPPLGLTPRQARRREIDKGQPEARVLRCRAASSEAVGFPCVEQVAPVRRHLRLQTPEMVP